MGKVTACRETCSLNPLMPEPGMEASPVIPGIPGMEASPAMPGMEVAPTGGEGLMENNTTNLQESMLR